MTDRFNCVNRYNPNSRLLGKAYAREQCLGIFQRHKAIPDFRDTILKEIGFKNSTKLAKSIATFKVVALATVKRGELGSGGKPRNGIFH